MRLGRKVVGPPVGGLPGCRKDNEMYEPILLRTPVASQRAEGHKPGSLRCEHADVTEWAFSV